MRAGWRSRPGLTAVCLGAALAGPVRAQAVREFGLHAVATGSDRSLGALGLYGARRLSERTRLAATAAGGVSESAFAFRGELLAHFLLNPRAARRPGLYALAGAALVSGPSDQGYLVLGAGIEAHPGARAGWALEVGVGGGVRVALGYRWRRFPPGWVPRK